MKQSQTRRLPVRVSPTFRILLAMVLGGLFVVVVEPRAGGMGEIGKVVIGLIKTLAAPLILFAVIDAFLRTTVRAKSGLLMLGISAVNATLAVVIALTLSNTLMPGRYLSILTEARVSRDVVRSVRPVHFLEDLLGLIPNNIVDPFRTNLIIPVVVLAVMGGLALRRHKDEQTAAGGTRVSCDRGFCGGGPPRLGTVARVGGGAPAAGRLHGNGTNGRYPGACRPERRRALSRGGRPWIGHARRVGPPGVGRVRGPGPCGVVLGRPLSPAGLRGRGEQQPGHAPGHAPKSQSEGVSDGAARMSACVVTNLNNDGILLYEAMAALIVAQAHGIDLSLGQQLMVAATCVLASVGIAGIPEAGLISLAIVLTTAKLPLDLLPLLLSVDWILGRCRAMTNVVGDVLGAVLLDRLLPCSSVDEGGSISVGLSSSVSARDPSEVETAA